MRYSFLIAMLCLMCISSLEAQQDTTQGKPVDRMPSFPEGTAAMYQFIYSEMRYPAEAKRLKISGQVITQFWVNEKGGIEDIVVTRGLGYGLDEEAIRVIKVMQEKYTWNPGTHNGKPYPVKFTLPLKFVLQK